MKTSARLSRLERAAEVLASGDAKEIIFRAYYPGGDKPDPAPQGVKVREFITNYEGYYENSKPD